MLTHAHCDVCDITYHKDKLLRIDGKLCCPDCKTGLGIDNAGEICEDCGEFIRGGSDTGFCRKCEDYFFNTIDKYMSDELYNRFLLEDQRIALLEKYINERLSPERKL